MSMNDIVAQFADEASFLWSRRDTAVGAPHFTLKDLWGLDERLEAHVDGLRVAGPLGWEACKANLNPKEPESLFPAAVLAFESCSDLRLKTLFDAADGDGKGRIVVFEGDDHLMSKEIGMRRPEGERERRPGGYRPENVSGEIYQEISVGLNGDDGADADSEGWNV